MGSVDTFIKYFKESLSCSTCQESGINALSNAFFRDFVEFTPLVIQELQTYATPGMFSRFYTRLADLKYLIVFDEDINKYWFAMRAYSGALSKLENVENIHEIKSVFNYYIEKYGERRVLASEHWFEHKRWLFLDSLKTVDSLESLREFTERQRMELQDQLNHFEAALILFIQHLKYTLETDL